MGEEKNFSRWPIGVHRTLNYPEIPVYGFLDSAAVRFPVRVAMRFSGMEITYGEFLVLVHRFANALMARGVWKGDRVAIHLLNCPQFAIAYYALLKLGAVFVPCSPLLTERELKHQLTDSGAETLITLDLFFAGTKKVIEQVPVKNLIVTSLADNFPALSITTKPLRKMPIDQGEDFIRLLEEGSPDPVSVAIDPRLDLAHLAYTGGTTGPPKGVMLTHYNIVVNVLQCFHFYTGGKPSMEQGFIAYDLADIPPEADLGMRPGRTTMVVVPWFHAMGTIAYLNLQFYAGHTMILFPRFDPGPFIRAVEKYQAEVIGGAPHLFITMIAHPDFARTDLSSVKTVISGAAPLSAEVMRRLMAAFPGVVTEGYGMTEVTLAATANPASRRAVKIGSVGMPIIDTAMKVIDLTTGKPVLQGEVGELCIRGPQCMQGYWNQPRETADVLIDGWMHTGDIGYEDSDGYFFITDRKKDMIIYKGYNVYPKELEEILFTHPAVFQCAVVGRLDEQGGEIPVAFVQSAPDHQVTGAEIMNFVNDQVAPYKQIRRVVFVSALPVSMVGKVLKRELRET
ncbi:MAG: class I adenylate-forming enzyme family protein [Smithellaceae bacterium]